VSEIGGIERMIKHMDMLGMVCPFPVVETEKEMECLAAGDELVIDFDCTQATETLPRWIIRNGHHIIEYQQIGEAHWQIKIRKG
jgi:TusA-related sulfurtransferase